MHTSCRPPYARFAHIDQALRGAQWPSAPQLASDLEVNLRTIRRDLQFMRERLGAPIAHVPRKGYHYTRGDFRLPGIVLSEGELLALFLAERLLQQYRGTPCADDLASLFRKIMVLLPETISLDLQHLSDAVSFRVHATDAIDGKRFRELDRAIRSRRRLDIIYWTAERDTESRRQIDPYHLAAIDGNWYLIAYCYRRKAVRMFCPNRIKTLCETGKTFARPVHFDIKQYLVIAFRTLRGTGPPQTIRLRFSAQAARHLRERNWHATQTLEEQADGALILTVRVNHLLEVKRLAMSYGADCEVLEPIELRNEILVELQTMMNRSTKPVDGNFRGEQA